LGIVPISSGDFNHKRMAVAICEKVTFGVFSGLIRGMEPVLGPQKRLSHLNHQTLLAYFFIHAEVGLTKFGGFSPKSSPFASPKGYFNRSSPIYIPIPSATFPKEYHF
jgi:hypothetical protein